MNSEKNRQVSGDVPSMGTKAHASTSTEGTTSADDIPRGRMEKKRRVSEEAHAPPPGTRAHMQEQHAGGLGTLLRSIHHAPAKE